jgi:hypothetical protein
LQGFVGLGCQPLDLHLFHGAGDYSSSALSEGIIGGFDFRKLLHAEFLHGQIFYSIIKELRVLAGRGRVHVKPHSSLAYKSRTEGCGAWPRFSLGFYRWQSASKCVKNSGKLIAAASAP